MGARVLFRDSQGRDGQYLLVPGQPCYVGRSLDCAVRTDDAMVSRKHSLIQIDNGKYVVEDLGSSNGTHVNDTKVVKQVLKHNDVVRCGSLWLRYVEDGPIVSPPKIPGQRNSYPPSPPPGRVASAPPTNKRRGTAKLEVKNPTATPALHASQFPESAGRPPTRAPAASTAAPRNDSKSELQRGSQTSAKRDRQEDITKDVSKDIAATEAIRYREKLEVLQETYDKEAADSKRLRAEIATLQERLAKAKTTIADKDEQVEMHGHVADEVRAELSQVKATLADSKSLVKEKTEDVESRDRQLERLRGDVKRIKKDLQDAKRELTEVSRVKDEGWRKLNEQLAEIEHLREIINEQEQMVEERRIGLVSQDEALKEVRGDKEKYLREAAALRAEMGEQKAEAARAKAQIEALADENKRISEMLLERQSDEAVAQNAEKLMNELRDVRVSHKRLEADSERVELLYNQSVENIERLESEVARLSVTLKDAEEQAAKSEAASRVVEEQKNRLVLALQKAEGLAEKATSRADSVVEDEEDRNELREKVEELTESLTHAQKEIEELRQAADTVGDSEPREQPQTGGLPKELANKAEEVYDDINDVLSEIRNNVILVHGEFSSAGAHVPEQSAQVIEDALIALKNNATHAKDTLRGLRELLE